MNSIILESQGAFIPGRIIIDNILIGYEAGRYINRKRLGKVGMSSLKIDMSKAYDRVEWEFIHAMLTKLGFPVFLIWAYHVICGHYYIHRYS